MAGANVYNVMWVDFAVATWAKPAIGTQGMQVDDDDGWVHRLQGCDDDDDDVQCQCQEAVLTL